MKEYVIYIYGLLEINVKSFFEEEKVYFVESLLKQKEEFSKLRLLKC